jgi:membrane protease YdiL (CAAX protease family)
MRFGSFMALLCLFISCQSLFQVTAGIQESILNAFGLSALESIQSATMDFDSLTMFLYAAVGAPVMEEIIFRGLVLRHLEPYGKSFTIVMSAFAFGIFHGNIVQIPYAFLVGLVLGYVAIEYNILWAMVLHMINNLVLGDFIGRVLPGAAGNAVVSWIIMVCSLVGAILLLVRQKDIREYCRETPIRDRDAGNFFSAPGMIALELFVLFTVASPLIDQIMEKLG